VSMMKEDYGFFEQKMNQKRVTEALELCIDGLCDLCPYRNSNAPGGCKDEVMLDALNMIAFLKDLKTGQRLGREYEEYADGRSVHDCFICSESGDEVQNETMYCPSCGAEIRRRR